MSSNQARILTIAGSDCSGGAGIQADLKTFAAHRVYGMSVVTAVTVQNTVDVFGVHPVPPQFVGQQIDAVFDDIGVDAIKIGMLFDRPTIEAVAEALERHAGPPVVLDPVMISKSGSELLQDDAVESLKRLLLPLSAIITPNLPEAARLCGLPLETESDREAAAASLLEMCNAVLLKGGHANGAEICDLLVSGSGSIRFVHPRIETTSTHGTGCTLSAAIAARLGMGSTIERAVGAAIEYTSAAIEAAIPLGRGCGPLNHLFQMSTLADEGAR